MPYSLPSDAALPDAFSAHRSIWSQSMDCRSDEMDVTIITYDEILQTQADQLRFRESSMPPQNCHP
jgi:hypothetical protein